MNVLFHIFCWIFTLMSITDAGLNISDYEYRQRVLKAVSVDSKFQRKSGNQNVLKNAEILIPSTTTPNLMNILFAAVTDKSVGVDAVVEQLSNVNFEKIDSIKKHKLTIDMYEAIGAKILDENADYREWVENHHDESYSNMIDIIFTFDVQDIPIINTVLTNWKYIITHYSIIIMVENTEVLNSIEIPAWLGTYGIYTLDNIRDSLSTRNMGDMGWLIGPEGFDTFSALRNFGLWVSNRNYVYYVDNTCKPMDDNVIIDHINNMRTPSSPDYFNLFRDPYKAGSDFSKGYPYHLRAGVPTAVSQGLWNGENHYDPLTLLVKPLDKNNRPVTFSITVPTGVLYSMSLANMVSDRLLLGPALAVVPARQKPWANDTNPSTDFNNYYDVLSGWIIKTVCDNLKLGVKVGTPYVDKAATKNDAILKELKDDLKSNGTMIWQYELYNFFMEFEMNETYRLPSRFCGGRWLTSACVFENILDSLLFKFKGNAQVTRFANVFKIWQYAWEARHGFLGITYPTSSKNSMKPSKDATCALITISHNEKKMFPIWLRYYLRHFDPTDVYVLDHLTTDGSLDNLPKGVRKFKMEGNKYAMPVRFRSILVQAWEDRLLRAGYKCVVFSDTDEIIVANPRNYKAGLKDFLREFADGPELYYRVTAMELAHMAYGNGSKSTQEPTLDWSKSVLAQRHFMVMDRATAQYNKPLLTKVPIAYTPGFHKFYDFHRNKFCKEHKDLVMFHMRSMDYEYCLEREEAKFNMTKRMEPVELHTGYASHWNLYEKDKKTGELCKYANSCFQGPLHDKTAFWDNTGTFPVQRLDPVWNEVDL